MRREGIDALARALVQEAHGMVSRSWSEMVRTVHLCLTCVRACVRACVRGPQRGACGHACGYGDPLPRFSALPARAFDPSVANAPARGVHLNEKGIRRELARANIQKTHRRTLRPPAGCVCRSSRRCKASSASSRSGSGRRGPRRTTCFGASRRRWGNGRDIYIYI